MSVFTSRQKGSSPFAEEGSHAAAVERYGGTLGEEVDLLLAKCKGEEAVAAICRRVEANELEAASIARLESLVRHGYKSLDLMVRVDGIDHHIDADWLVRLFR